MSTHLQGGGRTDFGANPFCVSVDVGVTLSCLHNILCEPVVRFLLNLHGYIIGS